jgi:hypothetical protein
MKLPGRMFWTTYTGTGVLGAGGGILGLLAGTGMLMFRRQVEPLLPLFLDGFLLLLGRLSGRYSAANFVYQSADYFWVVGSVYLLSLVWIGAAGWSAYNKPESDRKLDAYLQRKLKLESAQVAGRDYASVVRDPPEH